MNNRNPFKVPDNYFENFNKDIISQIANITPEEKQKKYSFSSYFRWISVAAVVIIIAIGGYYYNDNKSNNSNININTSESYEQTITTKNQIVNTDKQLASLQNDYYLFIEDEAMKQMYSDYTDTDNL